MFIITNKILTLMHNGKFRLDSLIEMYSLSTKVLIFHLYFCYVKLKSFTKIKILFTHETVYNQRSCFQGVTQSMIRITLCKLLMPQSVFCMTNK